MHIQEGFCFPRLSSCLSCTEIEPGQEIQKQQKSSTNLYTTYSKIFMTSHEVGSNLTILSYLHNGTPKLYFRPKEKPFLTHLLNCQSRAHQGVMQLNGYESYYVPNKNGIINVAGLNTIFHGLELGAKLLKIYRIWI